MDSLGGCVRKYKEQMRQGDIATAYRGIMKFMKDLKARLEKKHPECDLSSSIYMGHMDMTHFAFTPHAFSEKKLKFAIVFIHERCRFEIWFAAGNRSVQRRYRHALEYRDLGEFELADEGSDAVIKQVLTDTPDFDRPEALMRKLEDGTIAFIEKISKLLEEVNVG